MEAAVAAVEAGNLSREDVVEAMCADLVEVDAENACGQVCQKLEDAAFYHRACQHVADKVTAEGIQPCTWTTLPEDYEPDSNPFEITTADE
ncbi:hypothetical protein LJR098_006138 [Rhizobium sp. LjRoot98]|uniref:hypothetical protein n=1 Tax=unclassified Rhizobium TaxID=2613769 RepID=UPI0012E3FA4A|nr:hypothetical protein [Rhizobium sp. Root1204]